MRWFPHFPRSGGRNDLRTTQVPLRAIGDAGGLMSSEGSSGCGCGNPAETGQIATLLNDVLKQKRDQSEKLDDATRRLSSTLENVRALHAAMSTLRESNRELRNSLTDANRVLQKVSRARRIRNAVRCMFLASYLFIEAAWATGCSLAHGGVDALAHVPVFNWPLDRRLDSLFIALVLIASAYELLERFKDIRAETEVSAG